MAKQKIEKTNAARLLDRAKITYSLIPYKVDESDLAATHVAEQLGEDIATVFKPMVRSAPSKKIKKEGRFDLRIDGVSHHSWFRRKKDEFMEALGLPTSRRQNRGLKL